MTIGEDYLSIRRRRPTIRDVARLAGVDPSLVSRVVNNDPKASASAATRQRILDAVASLNYSASPAARGLRSARTWTLGLLLPDLSNPMYVSIVKGAEVRARELGYGLAIGSHVEGEREDTFMRLLREGRVDGLLVASGALRDEFLRHVATSGTGPVVLVNRRVRGVKASVIVNDTAGAKTAVEHLTGLGHTVLAGLFGEPAIDTTVRRRRGFEQGCTAARVNPIVIESSSLQADAGYRGAMDVLARQVRPTAIFASTLAMGIGVLRAARELSVPVPDALSVVALHDNDIADYLAPPLTTVALPTEKMGAKAADALISLIEGGPPRQLLVADRPQLVLRQSTAPANP